MIQPFACPVCSGKGQVPEGFYGNFHPYNTGTSAFPSHETCRSCNGGGVVWSQVQLSVDYTFPLYPVIPTYPSIPAPPDLMEPESWQYDDIGIGEDMLGIDEAQGEDLTFWSDWRCWFCGEYEENCECRDWDHI
jgi:hypothetical protein